MLNEERIKLMTSMASYEATEGKKNESVARHFRSDYVGLEVLKAVIFGTIAYMIVFGMYIYYDLENFLNNIYKMDLWKFASGILKYYVIFIVIYSVIVYIVFSVKYTHAKTNLKKYFNNLKYLSSLYGQEKKNENQV